MIWAPAADEGGGAGGDDLEHGEEDVDQEVVGEQVPGVGEVLQQDDLITVETGDLCQALQNIGGQVVTVDSRLAHADLAVRVSLGHFRQRLGAVVAQVHHTEQVSVRKKGHRSKWLSG